MTMSMKELLAKLLNRITGVDEPIEITSALASSNGWTCPEYGMVIARAMANGSTTGYYIIDVTNGINLYVGCMYDNSRANNTNCTTSFPVIKGHTYKQNYFGGQSRTAHYYKFK